MADKTINVRHIQRHDTESNWESKNPVLLDGELAFTTDGDNKGKYKLGDGKTKWSNLDYAFLNKSEVYKLTENATEVYLGDNPESLIFIVSLSSNDTDVISIADEKTGIDLTKFDMYSIINLLKKTSFSIYAPSIIDNNAVALNNMDITSEYICFYRVFFPMDLMDEITDNILAMSEFNGKVFKFMLKLSLDTNKWTYTLEDNVTTVYSHPKIKRTVDTGKSLKKIQIDDMGHVTDTASVTESDLPNISTSKIKDFPTSLPANGGNSKTVNGHTVNSDVPANAKFTDTWRPVVNGLTSTATDQSLSAYQGKILNDKFASYVPTSRKINNKSLTSDLTLTYSDVGAMPDRCYVLISDSYGGYNITANYLDTTLRAKLPTVNFKTIFSKPGAGFHGTGETAYATLLSNLDLTGVTDVILIGGFNDREASIEDILAGMERVRKVVGNNVRVHVGHHGWSSLLESDVRDLIVTNSIPAYRRCKDYDNFFYMTNYEYTLHDYSLFQTDNVHPLETGAAEMCKQISQYIMTGTCDVHYQYRVITFKSAYNTATEYKVGYQLDNDKVTLYIPNNTIQFTNAVNMGMNTQVQLLQLETGDASTRGFVMGMWDNANHLKPYINLNGFFTTTGTPQFVGMEGCRFVIQGGFLHVWNNTINSGGTMFQLFDASAMEIRGGIITIPTLSC